MLLLERATEFAVAGLRSAPSAWDRSSQMRQVANTINRHQAAFSSRLFVHACTQGGVEICRGCHSMIIRQRRRSGQKGPAVLYSS